MHMAVDYEKEECIKLILQYGHTHDQRDDQGLTPLMRAVYGHKHNITDLLFTLLPRQQYINEIMLFACLWRYPSSSPSTYSYRFTRFSPSKTFKYFELALTLQSQFSNAIPCEAYEFRRECNTIEELQIIQHDEDAMLYQLLLASERLYPARDETHLLVRILVKDVFSIYRNRGQYDRCISLLTHAYTISLSCKENLLYHWDRTCLFELQTILHQAVSRDDFVLIKTMIPLFESIFNDLSSATDACSLCFVIIYVRTFLLTK